MAAWLRIVLLFVGFLENFLFTGTVVGWATLNYMLQKEGVFGHLCGLTQMPVINVTEPTVTNVSGTSHIPTYPKRFSRTSETVTSTDMSFLVSTSLVTQQALKSCVEQERLLNLAFNICICVSAGLGSAMSYVIHVFGMRICRLIFNLFLSTGFLMLAFTSADIPFLLYPALSSIAVSIFALRITSLPIAELFPKQRSTIICLFTGTSNASATVLIFLKLIYDSGESWRNTFLIMAVASLLCLPVTFFLLPKTSIEELLPHKISGNGHVVTVSEEVGESSIECCQEQSKKHPDLPITLSIFSLNFFIFNFWVSWMALYSFYYLGSLNVWVERLPRELQDLSTYTDILGITLVSAVIIAPLGGVMMDKSMESPKKQMSQVSRCRCCFKALMLPTAALCAIQVCKFFDNTIAIYVSIVGFTVLRSLMIAVSTAFMRVRFPAEHFNRMIGITGTFRGVSFLLQFPLFHWETISNDEARNVAIFNMFCLAIASILPLHLMTPLLNFLLNREDRAVTRFRERQQPVT